MCLRSRILLAPEQFVVGVVLPALWKPQVINQPLTPTHPTTAGSGEQRGEGEERPHWPSVLKFTGETK